LTEYSPIVLPRPEKFTVTLILQNIYNDAEVTDTLTTEWTEPYRSRTRIVTKGICAFERKNRNLVLVPINRLLFEALRKTARSIGTHYGERLHGFESWLNGGVKMPKWCPVPVEKVSRLLSSGVSRLNYEYIKSAEVVISVSVTPRDPFNAELVKELLRRSSDIYIGPRKKGSFAVISFKDG